jgi:hypothetical protein
LKFFSNSTLDIDNGSRAVAGLQIAVARRRRRPATLGDMVVGLNTSGRMEISGGGTVTSARVHGLQRRLRRRDHVAVLAAVNCSGSIWTGNAAPARWRSPRAVTSTGNGYLGFSPGASGFVR